MQLFSAQCILSLNRFPFSFPKTVALLPQASQGVDPGTHVSVKSTSEIVHVTLSYAAATHALTSLLEWRDLASGSGGSTYKRQLAAADSSSVHTLVRNRLGVAAKLQLDFGNRL